MIAQIQMRRGTTAEWAAASPVVLAAGEPGWDSTLEGMKIGDGSTEWASLPWIDSKNRPDINADTLDGVHLADIRLGQNLLHNGDFRNPVNQRGVSGAISTGAYFFDRWIRNSGTVAVAAGYLTMASGAVIEQRIEGLYLAGATVTVSVQTDAETISGTGVFPTAVGTVDITLTGFGTATLGYNAGYMFVRFTASGSQNVIAVKIELGPVSTLHLDPPMDHAVELAKCQRYFFKLGTTNRLYARFPNAVAVTTSSLGMYIQFPCRMRIIPTFFYTGSVADYGSIPDSYFSDIQNQSDGASEGGAFLYFVTSGLTVGWSYSVRAYNSTTSSLCFSADL